jgi:GNAT superfamily N-acetyltransferase
MVAARLSAQSRPQDGPRPLNLARDIRPVLELLDLVFGPTLDAEGRRILNDNLSLSNQPAFLLRLSQAATGLAPGFVWEENGRIVGNVSLLAAKQNGRYLVANVAVHPAFRRRGIARVLMEEVIEHIQAQNGRKIMLQVQADNKSAIQLYESLGFETLGSQTIWDLTSAREVVPFAAPPAPFIRPLHGNEWRAALALDHACLHPEIHWPDPLPYDAYRTGLWQHLTNFINGRQVETWATADNNNKLIGLATISSEWGRPHTLTIRVSPPWRGQLEEHLLAKLLRRLGYLRRANTQIEHPADDKLTNKLLLQAGFRARRTLTVMKLTLT